VLIGDVRVADRVTVWFGAVLRGDGSHITIGEETSVQNNAVLHCAKDLPTVVGRGVTIGHGALLERCVIEDGAVVGTGAIVLQHSSGGVAAGRLPGAELEVVNPATEEVVAAVPSGDAADVELAVATAKRAFPEWAATVTEGAGPHPGQGRVAGSRSRPPSSRPS
jgi:carbonic anhydrase/acetyltransferase-like protein (isoleucine patch superfamily)